MNFKQQTKLFSFFILPPLFLKCFRTFLFLYGSEAHELNVRFLLDFFAIQREIEIYNERRFVRLISYDII